jgi:uncharacterized membrane protein YphA (DoxX/SURF4 family)
MTPLSTLARRALGLLFLASAALKIWDPASFALAVDNYRILPEFLVPATALVLPWLEAICAILLLSRCGTRVASLILGVLLVVFMAALGQGLVRGLDVDCGCFGGTGAAGSRDMIAALVRDAALLALAVWVFWRASLDRKLEKHARKERRHALEAALALRMEERKALEAARA